MKRKARSMTFFSKLLVGVDMKLVAAVGGLAVSALFKPRTGKEQEAKEQEGK